MKLLFYSGLLAGALLSAPAKALELESLPRCSWPSPIPFAVCLLAEPDVVNCEATPYVIPCEDYPGAVKAVTAKIRRFAGCQAEFEITFRDLQGALKTSKKTRAIDCTTLEPITAP